MRRRLSLTCALTAAVAVLAPAAPAVADPVFPVCTQVDTASYLSGDRAYTYLCLGGESGVYDPLWSECSTHRPVHESCRFRVTAGHTGAADVDAQLCTAAAGQRPVCTSVHTGTIPLLPVEPTHVCYGWSPWEPPCYSEVDEP